MREASGNYISQMYAYRNTLATWARQRCYLSADWGCALSALYLHYIGELASTLYYIC